MASTLHQSLHSNRRQNQKPQENTIHLSEDQVLENRKIKKLVNRAILFTLHVFFWIALLGVASIYIAKGVTNLIETTEAKASDLYTQTLQSLTSTQVIKEYIPTHRVPLEDLISTISKKRNLPTVVLQIIVQKESSNGKFLYRFEPDLYTRLRQSFKSLPDDEIRALASSHGTGQVLGVNAQPRCGIHWSKLYDDYLGLDCAAKILREELDRTNSKDPGARLWSAFKNYNGSGPRAENYANEAMAEMGKMFIRNLGSTL